MPTHRMGWPPGSQGFSPSSTWSVSVTRVQPCSLEPPESPSFKEQGQPRGDPDTAVRCGGQPRNWQALLGTQRPQFAALQREAVQATARLHCVEAHVEGRAPKQQAREQQAPVRKIRDREGRRAPGATFEHAKLSPIAIRQDQRVALGNEAPAQTRCLARRVPPAGVAPRTRCPARASASAGSPPSRGPTRNPRAHRRVRRASRGQAVAGDASTPRACREPESQPLSR